MERRQAIWPPRYNHLLLGGPVTARQARNQLNSSQDATSAAGSRGAQPRRTTAQDDAEAHTPDHATAHAPPELHVSRSPHRSSGPPKQTLPVTIAITPPDTNGSSRKPSPSPSAPTYQA